MRVIIPTRNRPTSLAGVLGYYERFYPDTEIVLADGSAEEFKPLNKKLAKETPVSVDYRPFKPDISLFNRLLMVLREEDDPYFVMAADDDYPIMETLIRARNRLVKKPEAVCAGGYLVHINLTDRERANARLDPVRQITAPTAKRRMQVFGQLPFTTTYAVARRELLIARYEFLESWNMPGFFDLGVGLMDMSAGQFLAIPEMGFICTRNFVHSYYRADEPLVYLRRAPDVIRLYDVLAERLQEIDGIGEEEAREMLSRVIGRRIAALAGAPSFRLSGFTAHAPYATRIIDKTRALFTSTFTKDGEQRKIYGDRLTYIAESLNKTLESADNAGESKKYEVL